MTLAAQVSALAERLAAQFNGLLLGDLSDVDTAAGLAGYVLTQQADGSFAPQAPANTGLTLTGGSPGSVLTQQPDGSFAPSAPQSPIGEVNGAPSINASQTIDEWSTVPAGGGPGNIITVSASNIWYSASGGAAGAALQYTIPAGQTRPVVLTAQGAFTRPGSTPGSSGPVFMQFGISEGTDATRLANAGYTAKAWAVNVLLHNTSTTGNVPAIIPFGMARVAANETSIDRIFGMYYFIFSQPTIAAGAQAALIHAADSQHRNFTSIGGYRV